MMKTVSAAAAAAFALLTSGCYLMPQSGNGMAKVSIGITSGARALKGVPTNVASVVLVVTAPGMAPVTATAAVTAGSITVSVPAGPARTFTLMLNSPSATLAGVATTDLQPGQTTAIDVTPVLAATQIVIPDYGNGRLVQIGDMSGTGWVTKTYADFTGFGSTDLEPYDIDFDSRGRIYVANSYSTVAGLFRIDDIMHTGTPTLIDTTSGSGITTVAVDRTKDRIYYVNPGSSATTILWKDADNLSNSGSYDIAAVDTEAVSIQAMAADQQGTLYLLVNESPPSQILYYDVLKYGPGGGILARSPANVLTSPRAIMVKGPYVYVSDLGSNTIVRLDNNSLSFVGSFGGPSTDPFVGPSYFLAPLNRPITVIDDTYPLKRVTSFDDFTGTGWTTFGSSGSGMNQFLFWNLG